MNEFLGADRRRREEEELGEDKKKKSYVIGGRVSLATQSRRSGKGIQNKRNASATTSKTLRHDATHTLGHEATQTRPRSHTNSATTPQKPGHDATHTLP